MRDEGISTLISVASIITLVVGYFSQNEIGIVLSITSLVGQISSEPSLKYTKFAQDRKILLTVPIEILKRCARSVSSNPSLSLHKNKKNSFLGFNFLGLPAFGTVYSFGCLIVLRT